MVPLCLKTSLLTVAIGLGLGASFVAHAQLSGQEDGGVSTAPDASVGEGGADRDNPEGEDGVGRVVVNCRSSTDCSPRFSCTQGKCRYSGIREAERAGCMGGPEAAMMLVGLGLAAAWRRR
jgi:MYXO-CTERM domain-containing protein